MSDGERDLCCKLLPLSQGSGVQLQWLPWNAGFLGDGSFRNKHVKGLRSLDELKNGKSRN